MDVNDYQDYVRKEMCEPEDFELQADALALAPENLDLVYLKSCYGRGETKPKKPTYLHMREKYQDMYLKIKKITFTNTPEEEGDRPLDRAGQEALIRTCAFLYNSPGISMKVRGE